METLDLSEDRIMTVWDWCSEAYIRHGFKLQFPPRTNPTKTYQWRYARAITLKFAEWDFDENTAKQFINIAVSYGKEVGTLRKGLAALHQSNMLQICYDKLQSQSDTNQQTISSLLYMHKWLDERSNGNTLQTLLYRNDVDELCNLVKWVQASRISPLYLSLSSICGQALTYLTTSHSVERELLPKLTKLYTLRSAFLEDTGNVKQVKQIFGPNWRKLCL